MKSLFRALTRNSQSNRNFTIEKDEDFYYVIKLKRNLICLTKKEEEAEELVEKLEAMYDWTKIKDLIHLREKDPEFYERIRPILRSYAVPKKLNGNYLSTLDSNKSVTYRLSDNKTVTGQHLVEGVAIREHNNSFLLDNVYKGRAITSMENYQQLLELYNKTKSIIPWQLDSINEAIEKEPQIKTYLSKAKNSIAKGQPIDSPPLQSLSRFQFIVMGGTDIEKMEAYVSGMKKLYSMVGLPNVKDKMAEFIKSVSADKQLKNMNIDIGGDSLHSLFVGPPGTGKTELARVMMDLLWSLDMIKERKLVELSKEDFVSSYIGGTEEITKEKITSALGGILFVDEAYMLKGIGNAQTGGGQDFGKIALEIIMRAMENHRGEDLVVIFAGYQKEIDELLNENPGLRSRFALTFQFDQYTPFELAEIANRMLSAKGFVTNNIQESLKKLMEKKAKSGALQGNARDVRVLVEEILRRHKVRIVDQSGDLMVIHPEDVESLMNNRKIKENDGLKQLKISAENELMSLVGLPNIKEEMISWTNYVAVEKKRMEQSGKSEPIRLHMSFEGEPGVGKTTVARIAGKLLKANGMLSSGHFVEILGKDLVAAYMGQTSDKVKEIVKKSMGGILFIDEAYSMINGKNDTFGREAVDTLIAEMENKGEDFVVILAGYTKEIEELFNSNPGFKSRIAQRFKFKDYTSEELVELFKIRVSSMDFVLENDAMDLAATLIEKSKYENSVDGNGRWIRNLVDKIKMAQANRIIKQNSDELYLINSEDVKIGYHKMVY